MRKLSVMAAILAFGLLPGCNGSGPAPTTGTAAPPHGGALYPMPENKGFVEIVSKSPKRGDTTTSEFTVYFLGPDHSPLSTPPTAATLNLQTPKGPQSISLKAQNGALTSPPGQSVLGGHELDGDLQADVGGQSITIHIAGR